MKLLYVFFVVFFKHGGGVESVDSLRVFVFKHRGGGLNVRRDYMCLSFNTEKVG